MADTPTVPNSSQMFESTKLTPLEEVLYQQWLVASGIKDDKEPDAHYDYRGLYKGTNGQIVPSVPGRHFPDTFKQHGHPTFSQESQYSKGPWDGGMWVNDQYIPQPHLMAAHPQINDMKLPAASDVMMNMLKK